MNNVRLTAEAVNDLDNLSRYITNILNNPSGAGHTIEKIIRNLHILEHHAEAGPSIEALTGYHTDLRFLVCGNYIAIYQIEGKTVSIVRILNSMQDYLRVLFGNLPQR